MGLKEWLPDHPYKAQVRFINYMCLLLLERLLRVTAPSKPIRTGRVADFIGQPLSLGFDASPVMGPALRMLVRE